MGQEVTSKASLPPGRKYGRTGKRSGWDSAACLVEQENSIRKSHTQLRHLLHGSETWRTKGLPENAWQRHLGKSGWWEGRRGTRPQNFTIKMN